MGRRLKLTQGNYSLLAALPSFVYFYGLFPGRIYRDSASLIELMRAGQSSDQWSALYFRYLQILTVNGRFLFIAAAVNLLFLTFHQQVFPFLTQIMLALLGFPVQKPHMGQCAHHICGISAKLNLVLIPKRRTTIHRQLLPHLIR